MNYFLLSFINSFLLLLSMSNHYSKDRVSLVLKETFGFDSLFPLQEQALESVLRGNDTLAIMNTSYGKSLLYQLPAAMKKDSLFVVVSPLIALMEDQVKQLERKSKLRAVALHSNQDDNLKKYNEYRVREGHINLVYVSPERLVTSSFMKNVVGDIFKC